MAFGRIKDKGRGLKGMKNAGMYGIPLAAGKMFVKSKTKFDAEGKPLNEEVPATAFIPSKNYFRDPLTGQIRRRDKIVAKETK